MPKQMLMSAPLRCPRLVTCLMLVACGWPLLTPSAATSNDLHSLADLTHPYASIFSPLLKALSEHGGSRWNPGPGGKMTPEESYMTYLTEVYRKTSRVQRSLDGRRCDTVRLIKPQDECFAQSNKEGYMQDLSYNLGQVRRKEHLLKSALVYSFAHVGVAPANRACYLSIQEQEQSEHCHLCSVVHYAVNFTGTKDGRNMRSWVEVDVTSFLKPLFKFHGRNIKLLINVTCHDEGRASGGGGKEALKFTLRPPPLLLYLTDTSKIGHRRLQEDVKALQAPVAAENTFHKQVFVKSESRLRQKRRWKRDSPKSKRGGKGLDPHLPELLPSSEFPTNDCALYDFRVRFSQLKLDHWIVFPPKYNPRYCRGICPRTMGFIYGSPVHTMVQNIIYEKLDSSVPRPSCIPSHYSPLSVMIFEEDGSYVYKEFEDMVATRCTCR